MNVGVPTETAADESRVALVPPAVSRLAKRNVGVFIETGAGAAAGWSDEAYRDVGATILDDAAAVYERADVVLHVRALGATPDESVPPYREGQVVIGLLGPYALSKSAGRELADRGVSAFALELVPRISRAQGMDVLTSMASVAGYKAVVVAADALPKLFPMQMTAAGTVRPADVFVVGAGVAGLQAIATAKRLGARVRAHDIRPEVREEVESLGADFVEVDVQPTGDVSAGGYAREQDAAVYRTQRQQMTGAVADADVVVTTAAVPGRPAPELVTEEMVAAMDAGSVVVDLGAPSGGNCELTEPDETVVHEGVTVFGPTNLPGTVSRTASQLYANNVVSLLESMLEDGEVVIDTTDEIVDATLLVHDGAIRHPLKEAETDVA